MMESILQKLEERDQKILQNQQIRNAIALTSKLLETEVEKTNLASQKDDLTMEMQDIRKTDSFVASGMDISQLQTQLISLYQEKDELTKNIEIIRNEIAEMDKKHNLMKQNLHMLYGTIDDIQSNVISLSTTRTTMEQQLDRLNRELAQLQTDLQKRTDEVEKRRKAIDVYTNQIKESKAYIKEAEQTSTHRPLKTFLTKLNSHSGQIKGVAFSSQFRTFLTTGTDKKLIQHNLPDLSESATIPTNGPVNNLRIHSESNFCCLSCADKVVRVVDLTTGRMISEMKSHTDQCTDSQWISRYQLLSSSKDRTIKIFDLNRNAVSNTISMFSGVNSLAPTAQPAVFTAGCSDGSIKIVDTRDKSIVRKIDKVHQRACICVVPSPLKDLVYSIGLDGQICITSITQATKMIDFSHPKLEVKNDTAKISISPDAGFLCAGSKNGDVILFDMFASSPATSSYVLHGQHSAPVICSAFATNLLITCDEDHTICLWK